MEEVTMQDAVSVKLEQDYGNQQILLFYVDEGGGNEQSIVTTVDDIQQAVPIDPAQNYYIGESPMETESDNNYIVMDASSIIVDNTVYENLQEIWSETEEKRLLVFYIDNKETFLEGVTKEIFLWSVACKTMLMGKTPQACKLKLESLRIKYKEILQKHSLHVTSENDVQWPYFVLAHQAFHNEVGDVNGTNDSDNEGNDRPTDNLATTLYDVGNTNILKDEPVETNQMRVRKCNEGNERLILKRPGYNEQIFRSKSNNADANVLNMLDLYLQLQNVENLNTKTKWEVIANKMGENNHEYWYRRFLNYRQYYITLLEKHGNDHSTITWPYMEIFNELFKDDEDFQKKYNFKETSTENESQERTQVITPMVAKPTWSTPEMVVLVKHYFDCYSEHQDPTLPKQFLWSEIGRLLDKDPDNCKSQYEELRANHLDKYIKGGYKTEYRDPLSILYDHIISMDVKNQMSKLQISPKATKDVDSSDLVLFFHDNVELFKDEMCYYVCWAAVARKLEASLKKCLMNWYALKAVYKSNLIQRKTLEILGPPWVYMDMFDVIFNHGNNATLLLGYEQFSDSSEAEDIDDESEATGVENLLDKNTNVTKILKYYAMHKDNIEASSSSRTLKMWQELSQEIGLTNRECASELKIIKAKYLDILESGMDESAKISHWPYYEACKKIFGSDLKMVRKQQQHKGECQIKFRQADINDGDSSCDNEGQTVKIKKWTEKSRELLLTLYLRQLKTNRDRIIDSQKMWREISIKLNKSPEQCKKMFVKLKRLNQCQFKGLIDEILSIKCNFHHPRVLKRKEDYKNVELPLDKVEKALEYYFKNLEEFVSEKYSKLYSWRQLSKEVNESVYKLYQKINYLKTNYNKLQDSSLAIILNLILEKESEILKSDVKITVKRGRIKYWSNEERIKLKELYSSFEDKFSNPKYLKKYLWHEIGLVLNRGYKECRKEFLLLKSSYDEEHALIKDG